jgi:hypothetical protein
MKLITEFCIYRTSKKETKQERIEDLVDTIRDFAHMVSFWDAKTCGDSHCVVAFGCFGEMEEATYIEANDIECEVWDWCKELADWCNDDGDDGGMNDERFIHKTVRVEIENLMYRGGFHVASYNKDDGLEQELFVMPIRKKEGGAS